MRLKIVFIVLVASPSVAAPLARSTIIPLCEGNRQLDRVTKELAASLNRSPGNARVFLPAAGSRLPCSSSLQLAAESAMGAGRAAFEELDLPTARREFENVRRQVTASAATPELFALYHEAIFYLAWIEQRLENSAASQRFFAEILVTGPEWRPAQERFPPQIIAAFDKEVTTSQQRASRALSVTSVPPAIVRLDVREPCQSPCTFEGVVEGDHYLRIEQPGYELLWRKVSVVSDDRAVSFRLARDERTGLIAHLEANDPAQILTDLHPLAPSAVVLVRPTADPGRSEAFVAHPSTRSFVGPLGLAESADISAVVEAVRAGLLLQTPNTPPDETAEARVPARPAKPRWWLWPAIGVAIGAVAVGVAVALPPDSPTEVRP